MARIAVNIVTYNSADTIEACLEAVLGQTYSDLEVLVVDNHSTDDTAALVKCWRDRGVRLVVNGRNEFFARAHNWAIDHTDSEFVLTLNPDVMMYPDYVARVVAVLERSPRVAGVNGKLLLIKPNEFSPKALAAWPEPGRLIDGAGIGMRRSRRPYLRGNRKRHGECCVAASPIFGVDAACGTYRRSMLEDIAIDGEYFDNAFVIYREDVDLAWRAQLLGWDSWFEPAALAYHIRGFHIGRGRRAIDPVLRRHSVKNGWLLLIKNDDAGAVVRGLPWILPYQLRILIGLLTVERTSLPAVTDALRLLPRMRRWRRLLRARQSVPPRKLRHWLE